ncbi:uncharacterized protein DS421_8g232010 [Arachis hypogaea]|nr:uncharacterized protein DS421_8g232010 [Arachis hypogaea]
MPIQPKKLFHLDITREATTPPNGQSHVRVGAVLPKVTLIFFFFRLFILFSLFFSVTLKLFFSSSVVDTCCI